MISAELNHNPYLLSTAVKFNGQDPNPDLLRREVMMKTINLAYDEIEEICHVLTMEV